MDADNSGHEKLIVWIQYSDNKAVQSTESIVEWVQTTTSSWACISVLKATVSAFDNERIDSFLNSEMRTWDYCDFDYSNCWEWTSRTPINDTIVVKSSRHCHNHTHKRIRHQECDYG